MSRRNHRWVRHWDTEPLGVRYVQMARCSVCGLLRHADTTAPARVRFRVSGSTVWTQPDRVPPCGEDHP